MAGDANLLLKFTGESAQAKATIDELKAKMDEFAHHTYNAKVGMEGQKELIAEGKALHDALELELKRPIKQEVKIELEKARDDLKLLRAELEHSLGGGIGAKGFDEIALGLNRITQRFGTLRKELTGGEDLAKGFKPLLETLTRIPLLGEAAAKGLSGILNAVGNAAADGGGGIGGFAKAAAQGFNELVKSGAAAAGELPAVGGAFASVAGAGALAIPVLLAVSSVILTLIGVAAALVSSLALAAAGLVLLATSFAATLGPAVLLAAAAFKELIAALQNGQQAQDTARQDTIAVALAYQTLADAERNYADARYQANQKLQDGARTQLVDARSLADSQRNLKQATVDAYVAWRDAVQNVHDALISVESAQLGIQDAELNVEKAKLHLRELKGVAAEAGSAFQNAINRVENVDANNPDQLRKILGTTAALPGISPRQIELKQAILDLEHAYLGTKTAADGLTQAQNHQQDAQRTAAKYAQEGIHANNGYRSALENLDNIVYKISQDTNDYNRIVKQGINGNFSVISALEAVQAAHRGVADALRTQAEDEKKFTDAQRALYPVLKDFAEFLKNFFAPILQGVFSGFLAAIAPLKGLLGGLQPVLIELGQAIGKSIVLLFQYLSKPEMLKALQELIRNSAKLVVLLVEGFGPILKIILNLANAAFPYLEKAVRGVVTWLTHAADSLTNLKSGNPILREIFHSFDAIGNVLKAVGKLLIAFFLAAAPFGDAFAKYLGTAANNLAKWAESKQGRDDIKKFFDSAVPNAIQLVKFIFQLVNLFIQIGTIAGPVLNPIITLFSDIASIIIKVIGFVNDLLGKLGDVYNAIKSIPIIGNLLPSVGPGSTSGGILKDAAGGATVGAGLGLLGGPFSELTVPAGAVAGGLIGGATGLIKSFLGDGGVVTRPTRAVVGEAGDSEAVIPLRDSVLSKIGISIAAATASHPINHLASPLRRPIVAGAHGGTHIDKIILPPQPGNTTVDPVAATFALSRELSRRGASA